MPSQQLLGLVGGLSDPGRRQQAADALARLLGGDTLVFFAPDPELGALLPAPGLPQTRPDTGEWRAFLDRCVREGEHEGALPGPAGQPVPAWGCALQDGSAAVLLGPNRSTLRPGPLRALLPLLGALFRNERKVAAVEARARSAAEALAVELQEQASRLREQATELELLNEEVVERTEEAERAREAAERANRAKSDFLASMSHELRTPINAVIGYAELLNLGITGPVTPDQQAQLARIRESSAHLLSLVNDVLDLAKVEAGQMAVEHQRESVVSVAAEAVDLARAGAAAREIELVDQCDDPRAVYFGDRDRVRQILVNLLSNAIKFTEPGGSVTLRCSVQGQAADDAEVTGPGPWTCVSVEDTGIGLDEQDLARVFQPFVQAESGHTRRQGGTGLGLTISRQFARLMGGDLTVESRPGEGSRFTLWLPASSPVVGTLDPRIRVGAVDRVEPWPEGLAEVGRILQARLASIVASFARRLRGDPQTPLAAAMSDAALLDHAPVFVADLAGIMMKLDRSAGDSAVLREAGDLQRIIAAKHGADRARRGWTASALRREFDVLQREIARVVRESTPAADLGGVLGILDSLIEGARRASLRSLRAASAGDAPAAS